jgi:hypothetical protein
MEREREQFRQLCGSMSPAEATGTFVCYLPAGHGRHHRMGIGTRPWTGGLDGVSAKWLDGVRCSDCSVSLPDRPQCVLVEGHGYGHQFRVPEPEAPPVTSDTEAG